MNPVDSGAFAELFARYKHLLEADHLGPPNPGRRAQIQVLADQLRHLYPSQLAAEASKHKHQSDSMEKNHHQQSQQSPMVESTPLTSAESPVQGMKYIDPKLGDQLRKELLELLGKN